MTRFWQILAVATVADPDENGWKVRFLTWGMSHKIHLTAYAICYAPPLELKRR